MATHYIHKYDSAAQFAAFSPELSNAFPIGSIKNAEGHAGIALVGLLTAAAYGAASNYNYLLSKITLTPTSTVTAANGLNAIRGEVNLSSGKTLSSGFVTGVYGRANVFGTVAIGSGDLAAVYGKMDLNGSTLTSGHIAPVQSNIVNPPADSSKVDGYYGESAGGNVINSHFKAFGKAAYVFDIETNVHSPEASETTAVGVTQNGYLSVNVNGSQRYIPLYTSHA